MRAAGLEPARPFGRGILSPLRLPISPPGQEGGAERNTRGRIVKQRPGDSYELCPKHEAGAQGVAAQGIVRLSVKIAKREVEAGVGIEPAYAELQSAA